MDTSASSHTAYGVGAAGLRPTLQGFPEVLGPDMNQAQEWCLILNQVCLAGVCPFLALLPAS